VHHSRATVGGFPTLTTTHLAAVILLGLLLDLDWNEWFVALLFGIGLDIDHIFAAPGYIGRNGVGAILAPTWDDGSGFVWRSVLHYPVGVFIVMPLAIGWRLMIPLVFWVSHLSIDYLQSATLAHSALVEGAFFAALCSGIFALGYYRWRVAYGNSGLVPFLLHIKNGLKLWIDGSGRSNRGIAGRT
jgi:hypothetical protein